MKFILPIIVAVMTSVVCTSCQMNSIKSNKPTELNGQKPPVCITISIAENGGITLGSGLAVTVEELVPKMKASGVDKSYQVVIRTDRKAREEVLLKVLDKLANAKFSKVNITTTM